jgi:hypothetical protein
MGAYYGSVHVHSENREAVRAVLARLSRKNKNWFWLGPNLGGWIGVYPNLYGQDSSVARDLARGLPGELFYLMVRDDDVFAYDYYREGIASTNIAPDPIVPTSCRSARGRPCAAARQRLRT